MERNVAPPIVTVERLSNGIVVKFADGSCAFYSDKLLYVNLPQAELQNEKAIAW